MADFLEGLPQPRRPQRPRLRLPRILDAKAVLRRYDPPRPVYRGPRRIELEEGVEILVTTSQPIEPRAVTPVLLVGDVALDEWETVDERTYRFFAPDAKGLEEGAPLALAWPDDRAPPGKSEVAFRLGEPPADS